MMFWEYVITIAEIIILLGLFLGLPMLFFLEYRNTRIYEVRVSFCNANDREKHAKLPTYGQMLYNPRHWHRWSRDQWLRYVEPEKWRLE